VSLLAKLVKSDSSLTNANVRAGDKSTNIKYFDLSCIVLDFLTF
jgi:hypothetical protein